MPIFRFRMYRSAATITFTVLVLSACSGPRWEEIRSATLSADQLTLTVNLTFGEPDEDGTYCERITDKKVTESSSQVIIGVEVDQGICHRSLPWEEDITTSLGYRYPVQLKLKSPLTGRAVIDSTSHQRVRIIPSES